MCFWLQLHVFHWALPHLLPACLRAFAAAGPCDAALLAGVDALLAAR
jgi:hypothetical protein